MLAKNKKPLRLLMPQWQGGNNHAYHFGAQLLAWLAPATDGPIEIVDITFDEHRQLKNENGIVGRSEIIPQLFSAKALIEKHMPEELVVLGGDCLVDLVPFVRIPAKVNTDSGST